MAAPDAVALPHASCACHGGPPCRVFLAGLQTTGAWLIFSQGFVVAAAMRSTTLCCGSYLADALHQVLSTHGGGWAASLLASTDQSRLCLAYASGMQIGVRRGGQAAGQRVCLGCPSRRPAAARGGCRRTWRCLLTSSILTATLPLLARQVGYVGVVLVGLLAEWRQRMAFAAKHQLPPPAMIDLFALNGTLLSMLFFVWRVALAEALRLPGSSTCDAAGSVCAARP